MVHFHIRRLARSLYTAFNRQTTEATKPTKTMLQQHPTIFWVLSLIRWQYFWASHLIDWATVELNDGS